MNSNLHINKSFRYQWLELPYGIKAHFARTNRSMGVLCQ
jgi:hypothetical protein